MGTMEPLHFPRVAVEHSWGYFMPEYHKSMAAECLRLARESADDFNKTLYLEMAQNWLKLADRLAKDDKADGANSPLRRVK